MSALVAAAMIVCGCSASPDPDPPRTGPEFLNHDPSVRYVGRDACVSCHKGNAANFARTGMGRSFYPMTADRVIEDFTDDNEFVDPASGLHYRMFRRDGRFYQRQFLLDARGREVAVDERELVYAVGSANHSRGYVTVREDRLFQAPVCWDPTTDGWMFCPGFELQNDHFSREVSYTCLFCHNGRVELVEGERNRYVEPLSHGIGCERCHGPGELHVERWREDDGWGGGGEPDPTIVNPARLERDARIEVCFQCHLGDTTATERVFRHGRPLSGFRPGQRITEVLVPFRFVQQTQYDFSLVSQADRLLLSRCYTESDGRLECLTCHNPHIPVYEKQPGSFRENCRTCHELDDCAAPGEQRQRTLPPDDCVPCHMRKAVSTDRKHALFTDHWIRRDVDLEQRDPRTNWELEPIYPEQLAEFPPGEQAYYLARAYFLRASEAPLSVRPELWERARGSFEQALELGFDEVDAWFFLAKCRMFLGHWTESIAALREALARDPKHHDAAFALGQSLTALGRFGEASETFAGMLDRDPDNPMALAERGRSQWALGDAAAAIAIYQRAIDQESWNADLHLNLGMTLASVGRFEDAVDAGREAARLNPDDPNVWEFLANALAADGREEPAAEARRQFERIRR